MTTDKKPGYLDGGLRQKYIIAKADGTPVDPEAEYFVLRIDKDPHARKALKAYAGSVRPHNSEFADDLDRWRTSQNYPRPDEDGAL